jgi:hypothetical protein
MEGAIEERDLATRFEASKAQGACAMRGDRGQQREGTNVDISTNGESPPLEATT